MWSVPRPSHDAEVVFRKCIARSRQPVRDQLLATAPEVVVAAKAYEIAATAGATHLLQPKDFKSANVSAEELQKTYTQRMAGVKAPGREIYDQLRSSIDDEICPLCGHRPVASLDHALPKKHFPLLSVIPSNLVPCCSDCNHSKSESVATKAENVYLHPYFDDIDDDVWLSAEIVEFYPTAAFFRVDAPTRWSRILTERVNHHFNSLGLANLYTAQAGTEIRALERVMERAFLRNGADGVREELADHRDGRRLLHQNAWQGALFHALISSDWYCNGGFRA